MPYSINKTFLVLIPKTKHPFNFNHYRPISLCNFAYNIISKILIERMKKLMGMIVSPNQEAFVEGHSIAENMIIAQEIVHKIKKHKNKNGLMLIKVDLKKAYDRLEWGFVERALNVWGFFKEVQQLIKSCLGTVQYSILLNDGISGSFSSSCGFT